jgi:hypothetical protein
MRSKLALRRAATIGAVSLVMVLLGATAAWAPKTLTLPVVDGPCRSGTQAGYLLGEFSPERFLRVEGNLAAQGDMNGTCDLPTSDVVLTRAPLRANATIVNADCRLLVLELGRGLVRGVFFDLEGDLMVFESDVNDAVLCRIAEVKDDPKALVPLLNEVLETTS